MRVLLATFGSFGDVNPYIALALALRERGHEGVLAAPEYYRAVIEREGIPFHPLRPDANMDDHELLSRVMDPKRGTNFILEEILLPALPHSYEDLLGAAVGCDVMVSHTLVYAGPLVADATSIPWASCTLQPLAFMSPSDPPVLSPLQGIAWLRHLGRLPNAALLGVARLAVKKWVKAINKLRQTLGLPIGTNPIFEGQFSPQLALALFSRQFGAPQRDWPTSVVQPGFVTYDGSHGRGGMSKVLECFLNSGSAPVVFTLGTSSVTSLDGLLAAGIEAVSNIGMRAVIVADERHVPPDLIDENILVVASAPFRQLLPRASIIVHPRGVETIGISLQAGRPSLLMPVSADHPDNAARMSKLGIARVLKRRHRTASHLTRELQLLSCPEWRARAEKLATVINGEPGVAGACEAIEGLYRRRERR
jgi:UDP:flavonoid glycosyltransferase YjiC (YdhE family)